MRSIRRQDCRLLKGCPSFTSAAGNARPSTFLPHRPGSSRLKAKRGERYKYTGFGIANLRHEASIDKSGYFPVRSLSSLLVYVRDPYQGFRKSDLTPYRRLRCRRAPRLRSNGPHPLFVHIEKWSEADRLRSKNPRQGFVRVAVR